MTMFSLSLWDTLVFGIPVVQAAVVVLSAWFFIRLVTKKRLNLPPGPRGLPLIGDVLEFRDTSLTKKTLEFKEKYGPVVRYRLGLQEWIAISSIEALTEAYIQRGTDFASRPHITSLYVISEGENNIGFAPYTDDLKFRRKIVMRALRQYVSETRHSRRVHEAVLTCISNMLVNKGSFDPHPYISHVIFSLIHDLCFGYTLPIDHADYIRVLSLIDGNSGQLSGFWEDTFPVLQYFPTQKFRKFVNNAANTVDYIAKHMRGNSEIFYENEAKTLMDYITQARKQTSDREEKELNLGFTNLHVKQIFFDIFAAGISTSRFTLKWIFLVLAANQTVQNKMHEEIDSIVGNGVPSEEHRADLVYTEAVILEVMRMYPVLPMSIPHETLRQTKVAGYDIPAKMRVVVNQYAILNDPNHWKEPEIFMPERFICYENGKKALVRHQSWIPFGIGSRRCFGELLAKLNVLYTVVGLLQKLNFHLPPEAGKPDFTPRNLWLSFVPKYYKIVVTSRG